MKYSVAGVKSISLIEAEQVTVDNGVLIFTDAQGALRVAIASGHWTAVRQADIQPDTKPA